MDILERFLRSYAELTGFLKSWTDFLNERCENSAEDRVQASYYIWARYTMSMGTTHRLSSVQYLPDLYVIGRGCIEFSASLKGVMSDAQLAHDYLEFEKHAKAGILKFLESGGELEKAKIMKEHLNAMGIANVQEYGWDKWCTRAGGITGVVKKYGKPRDLRLYKVLSHFAHGSVLALQILKNMQPDPQHLAKVITAIYSAYVLGTESFLNLACGPIITQDSELCKKSFLEVARQFA